MRGSDNCIEEELKDKVLTVENELKESRGHIAMNKTFYVKTIGFYIENEY